LQQHYRILVINPGSTSTKIGVFSNEQCIFEETIRHSVEETAQYNRIIDQYEFRKNTILEALDHEGMNISKLSGVPEIPRKSIFHALNQKAVARRVAKDLERPYEDLNIIVTHMGGGITVGAHKEGRVVDVNNGLHGDGPFSPERAGTVPAGDLVSLCFSGEYYREEIMKKLVGQGGFMAYLDTNDALEVEKRIEAGDEEAEKVYDAMAYQIAKEIAQMSAVLHGKVDAIALTGGLAYGKDFVAKISERVNWIADCLIYPGENELQALTEGALRVLREEEEAKTYPNPVG